MNSPYSDFRQFALGVYGADGVSAAALLLQEGTDVDVNVLLLAASMGAVRGRTFRAEDVVAAQHRVGQWHADVVRPLRALRTRLKTGPPPAPGGVTERLRRQIKAVELDAELIELDELDLLAQEFDAPAAAGTAAQRAATAMEAVLAGHHLTTEESTAITVIAAAAAQYAEER